MNKAVLMSIKPKYCEKIFNGEKTIEVRKRAPKLKPPFKVYVYCTKPKFEFEDSFALYESGRFVQDLGGFVIGEFVCREISPICFEASDPAQLKPLPIPGTGLTDVEIINYLGNGVPGYGLHISRLRFYDKPKDLSRFIRPCPNSLYCESCATFSENRGRCFNAALQITRPPQSWMYVENWDFQF